MTEKWEAFNADLRNPRFHQKAGPIVIKHEVPEHVVHMATAAPELYEALKAAHVAINACIHYEQNPHNERIERVADEAIQEARRLETAALTKAHREAS